MSFPHGYRAHVYNAWYDLSMKYVLPKPYLSYSAINTFLTNPSDFRKRYYENIQLPVTPELLFGKRIGELLEHDDSTMKHVLRYDTAEFELKFEVDGIQILGYIDTYDSVKHKVGEYKTGKTPWTQGRVEKHLQLDIYSLGVEMITGSVDDECVLIWMETERVDRPKGGRVVHGQEYDIQFTGKVKEFVRTITSVQREEAYNTIVRVAQDISEDYTDWLSSCERKPVGGRKA